MTRDNKNIGKRNNTMTKYLINTNRTCISPRSYGQNMDVTRQLKN